MKNVTRYNEILTHYFLLFDKNVCDIIYTLQYLLTNILYKNNRISLYIHMQ